MIRKPIPRACRAAIRSMISPTSTAWTLAKGSSSRTSRGSVKSARPKFEQLLLPARKPSRRQVCHGIKTEERDDLVGTLAHGALGCAHAGRREEERDQAFPRLVGCGSHQVLADREVVKLAWHLESAHQSKLRPLLGRQSVDRALPEQDAAAIRADEAGQHREQCRLSRPVRSDDAEEATGFERERDTVEDMEPPEGLADLADEQLHRRL